MVGVKDTKPVGKHLGKDKEVDESPGMVSSESCITNFLKSGEVGIKQGKVGVHCVGWGKVGETERKLGHQIKKQGWYKEAVNSLISELNRVSSEQGVVGVEACNN